MLVFRELNSLGLRKKYCFANLRKESVYIVYMSHIVSVEEYGREGG